MEATTHRIEALSQAQCVDLLSRTEVGRIVFSDQALPAILPVTFIIDDDCIVVRTARGSRLARAVDGAVVAFEADEIQPCARGGWSVVVTGQAWIEPDPSERNRLAELLTPWVPGFKDVFIRIPLTVVTGRRVSGRPTAHQHSKVRSEGLLGRA
jgi:nitroimidazol reductase NimA-like FMN-containing flavoprotein (pyridoxamine 5'-phosphate oxidase superfamily)